jgi:hypothetical protein
MDGVDEEQGVPAEDRQIQLRQGKPASLSLERTRGFQEPG